MRRCYHWAKMDPGTTPRPAAASTEAKAETVGAAEAALRPSLSWVLSSRQRCRLFSPTSAENATTIHTSAIVTTSTHEVATRTNDSAANTNNVTTNTTGGRRRFGRQHRWRNWSVTTTLRPHRCIPPRRPPRRCSLLFPTIIAVIIAFSNRLFLCEGNGRRKSLGRSISDSVMRQLQSNHGHQSRGDVQQAGPPDFLPPPSASSSRGSKEWVRQFSTNTLDSSQSFPTADGTSQAEPKLGFPGDSHDREPGTPAASRDSTPMGRPSLTRTASRKSLRAAAKPSSSSSSVEDAALFEWGDASKVARRTDVSKADLIRYGEQSQKIAFDTLKKAVGGMQKGTPYLAEVADDTIWDHIISHSFEGFVLVFINLVPDHLKSKKRLSNLRPVKANFHQWEIETTVDGTFDIRIRCEPRFDYNKFMQCLAHAEKVAHPTCQDDKDLCNTRDKQYPLFRRRTESPRFYFVQSNAEGLAWVANLPQVRADAPPIGLSVSCLKPTKWDLRSSDCYGGKAFKLSRATLTESKRNGWHSVHGVRLQTEKETLEFYGETAIKIDNVDLGTPLQYLKRVFVLEIVVNAFGPRAFYSFKQGSAAQRSDPLELSVERGEEKKKMKVKRQDGIVTPIFRKALTGFPEGIRPPVQDPPESVILVEVEAADTTEKPTHRIHKLVQEGSLLHHVKCNCGHDYNMLEECFDKVPKSAATLNTPIFIATPFYSVIRHLAIGASQRPYGTRKRWLRHSDTFHYILKNDPNAYATEGSGVKTPVDVAVWPSLVRWAAGGIRVGSSICEASATISVNFSSWSLHIEARYKESSKHLPSLQTLSREATIVIHFIGCIVFYSGFPKGHADLVGKADAVREVYVDCGGVILTKKKDRPSSQNIRRLRYQCGSMASKILDDGTKESYHFTRIERSVALMRPDKTSMKLANGD